MGPGGVPVGFKWTGGRYRVREVLDRWLEAGRWWSQKRSPGVWLPLRAAFSTCPTTLRRSGGCSTRHTTESTMQSSWRYPLWRKARLLSSWIAHS